MPTSGTSPDSLANMLEGRDVQPARAHRVGVAGPPAAAFGEEHDRQPPLLGQMQHAVLLLVIAHALRAGEHGVVVGHRDDARFLVGELVAVHTAQPHHQPVARRALDQFVHRVAAQLAGHHQARIFGEGTRIAQIVDILARRALAGLAPLGHRVGPRWHPR